VFNSAALMLVLVFPIVGLVWFLQNLECVLLELLKVLL